MNRRCFPRSRGPDSGQPRTQPRYRQWVSPRQDSPAQRSPRVLKPHSASGTPVRKDSTAVRTSKALGPEGEPSAKIQHASPAKQAPAKVAAAEEPGAITSAPRKAVAGTMRIMGAHMVKKMVYELVPAQQSGDPYVLPTFLKRYQRFATTDQVLDLLFERYRKFEAGQKKDDSCKKALCSILQTWLQRYPGHFHQADDLSCLKKLVAYVAANMPDTDFELQATNLLMELEYKKYKEMVDELDSKAASEAAPQPEPLAASLPQAVQPPALEALQPAKAPTSQPGSNPTEQLRQPGLKIRSQLEIQEAGMAQKAMKMLTHVQQTENIFQRLTGTHQVLHLLFPRAFCSLVGTELESLLAYIYQPLHQDSQNSLMLRRRPQMPLSFLALHVYILLSQFEDQKAQEAEPEAQDFTNNLDTTLASALQSEPPEPALDTPEDAEPENQADQPPVKTKRWLWSRLKLRGTNHSQGRPQHRLPNWLRTLGACFCMRPSGQSQG